MMRSWVTLIVVVFGAVAAGVLIGSGSVVVAVATAALLAQGLLLLMVDARSERDSGRGVGEQSRERPRRLAV